MYIETTLNPEDLKFHAARFASAEKLQDLLWEANALDEDDTPVKLHVRDISTVADLCVEDGADWGNIPCLGGPADVEWHRILDLAMESDYWEDLLPGGPVDCFEGSI